MRMCKYSNLFHFIEKQPTTAQSPDNFNKIVKVKRKANENVMIRKLQFCGLVID